MANDFSVSFRVSAVLAELRQQENEYFLKEIVMLEDAMAENLVGISLVAIETRKMIATKDEKHVSVGHFMRQNGMLPEEVVAQPIATTPPTRKYPGPQWID